MSRTLRMLAIERSVAHSLLPRSRPIAVSALAGDFVTGSLRSEEDGGDHRNGGDHRLEMPPIHGAPPILPSHSEVDTEMEVLSPSAPAQWPRVWANPSPKASPLRGLNHLVVFVYKIAGFAVLTAILAGLASYLGAYVFYLFDRTWIAPTVVSPTDDRVVALGQKLAEQASLRQKLAADRAVLVANLEDTNRVIAMQETFQEGYQRALSSDVAARRKELVRLETLKGQYAKSEAEIRQSNTGYGELSRERLDELYKAHLIDKDGLVTGQYQLSQLVHSNLGIAEKSTELDSRSDQLQREAAALHSATPSASGGQLSYDALRAKQEYLKSMAEAAKAKDSGEALKKSIAATDLSIAQYDRVLKGIQDSPYLKAVERRLTVAFVPYENLQNVRPGAMLYGCRLGLLFCRPVGKVRGLLEGEVSSKHPMSSSQMRGLIAELDLQDAGWAREKVLFARKRPLGL